VVARRSVLRVFLALVALVVFVIWPSSHAGGDTMRPWAIVAVTIFATAVVAMTLLMILAAFGTP
jgi:hypothetical protein